MPILGILLAVSAVCVGIGAAAEFPGVKPRPLFTTPGAAAYCYTDVAGYEDSRAKLFCWTPNDGWWVSIEWNGRRARKGVYDTHPQIVHGMAKLKGYTPQARLLRFAARPDSDRRGNRRSW